MTFAEESTASLKQQQRPPLLTGRPLSSALQWYSPPARQYTCRELLLDRMVNFSALVMALFIGPYRFYVSWASNDSQQKQLGFLVSSLGLVIMFACSAAFHYLACYWSWRPLLLSLDHLGITAMIMGSFFPLMLHCGGFKTLAFVCFLGIGGELVELFRVLSRSTAHSGKAQVRFSVMDRLNILRYIVMGWACMMVLPEATASGVLPTRCMYIWAAAGVLFTGGVCFLVQNWREFHWVIWHGAIVVASLCLYSAEFLLIGVPSAF